jgi:hypothetical protein
VISGGPGPDGPAAWFPSRYDKKGRACSPGLALKLEKTEKQRT